VVVRSFFVSLLAKTVVGRSKFAYNMCSNRADGSVDSGLGLGLGLVNNIIDSSLRGHM
tara:strand:+ start:554 stop:727 length:174 start_codon:yes stop_codon:yes gene_type:complete